MHSLVSEKIFRKIDEAELTPANTLNWANLYAYIYHKCRVADAAAGVALFAAYAAYRLEDKTNTDKPLETVGPMQWRDAAEVTDSLWQQTQVVINYETLRAGLIDERDPADHVIRGEQLPTLPQNFGRTYD